MKATLISPDGTQRSVEPKGESFTLEELQALVGGYIQVIPLDEEKVLVVNEDGKMMELNPNKVATEFIQELLWPGDYVAGNALICQSDLIR